MASGNFFLVGLMGAGKTTVGRCLAKATHKEFYDSDHIVEARTGVRIPTIFDIEGEQGFRQRETEALRALASQRGIVLATGGGAVISEENRQILSAGGYVIYLRASPEDLYARTKHDKNRPLLQTADPLARLTELFAIRDPLYHAVADLVVDTSRQSVNSLTQQILKILNWPDNDHCER
ncbi:shikimate kinase [Parachitinimonas caeni]|nr:shikimate kinase [Parachitinimonas caeni]